jgi:hypothetical protein
VRGEPKSSVWARAVFLTDEDPLSFSILIASSIKLYIKGFWNLKKGSTLAGNATTFRVLLTDDDIVPRILFWTGMHLGYRQQQKTQP